MVCIFCGVKVKQCLEWREEVSEMLNGVYKLPKSICVCGHNGDGVNSQHLGLFGHGACRVRGCQCSKFTWARFTTPFLNFYQEMKKRANGTPGVPTLDRNF